MTLPYCLSLTIFSAFALLARRSRLRIAVSSKRAAFKRLGLALVALVLAELPNIATAQNAYIPVGDTLSVINTKTNSVIASVYVGQVNTATTGGIAISNDGTKVYVTADTATGGSLVVINLRLTWSRLRSRSEWILRAWP